MDEKEQMLIWHTKTVNNFNSQNFDNILYPSNIIGTETYIVVGTGDNKKHIEGYVLSKKHKNQSTNTIYFVRTKDIDNLPLIINKVNKVHSKGNVYQLLTEAESIKIVPQQDLTWKQIIDMSGIPAHSNKDHYTLYKNKVLYGRTKGQVYYRVVTESAFGKDKYKEAIRLLFNSMANLSDPTTAKLFYAACHNKDITINEMPTHADKKDFQQLTNMLMRIGDGTTILDNRSRKTEGTMETAHTEHLSTSFIHNIPSYYHSRGHKCFEDVFPYNVINRYFYTLYEGYLEAKFPNNMNHEELAIKYSDFFKKFIKSVLWYEENWHRLKNRYPEINLDQYEFQKKEARFKDHFIDFAKCLSHYTDNIGRYKQLLDEEYKCHQTYRKMIRQDQQNIEEENVI